MTAYPPALKSLEEDFKRAPDTALTALARALVEKGKALDIKKSNPLAVNERFPHIRRDLANPPHFTHPDIIGASWADNEKNPLQAGERWNAGRKATYTGITYAFNQSGQPLNPYYSTGLTGRGALGGFGPNHAVDNGILALKKDDDGEDSLYVMGITRKGTGMHALAGGFVKYEKTDSGIYILDSASATKNRTEEFFEEMVSGSIPLLPQYAARVDDLVQAELKTRSVSAHKAAEIREQAETQLKMQQVRDMDPGFFERLTDVIGQGRECFAGPILAASRNTDNAWIETRLAWVALSERTWQDIRGKNPVFDYQFSAGDDAGGLFFKKLDGDLLKNSYTHATVMTFMAASFLLDSQQHGNAVAPGILRQVESMNRFMENYLKLDAAAVAKSYPGVKTTP